VVYSFYTRSKKTVATVLKPVFRCSKPLSQHFLEKKKRNCPFTLFNKATKESDRKKEKYKIKNQEGMKKRKSLVQKVFCL